MSATNRLSPKWNTRAVKLWIAFLGLAMVGLGASLYAQTTTATLNGTITDPSQGVISGAQVTAVETATGIVHQIKTNAVGQYTIPALPPGTYKVTVSAPGFAQSSATTTLLLQQVQRLDFVMKVGTGTETVTVSAAAQQIDTESHEVSDTISYSALESLPNNNAPIGSLAILPNVQEDDTGETSANNGAKFFGVMSLSLSAGGITYGFSEFLQDGVSNTAMMTQTANMQPDLQAVSATNVTQNGADARYSSPSVVNIVTKSGSNSVHGVAYDYIENDDLNAQGEIKPASVPPLRYNQFGVNIGGPFIKNKLFYFLDYAGLRDGTGGTLYSWVPTAAEAQGNFSADPYTVYDPATYNPTTGAISPFPNNTIPTSRISQFATYLETFLPAPTPNRVPASLATLHNYEQNTVSTDIYNAYEARLDAVVGPKDTVYAAWESTNPLYDAANQVVASLDGTYVDKDTNVLGQETHIVSPELVNIARVGYNRSNLEESVLGAGTEDYDANFGLQGLDPAQPQWTMPGITFYLDTGSFGIGSVYAPQGDIQNLLEFSDEVNWTHGKHSMFFGGEIRHTRFQGNWVVLNNGAFDFFGYYTGAHTAAALAYPYPNGFADLLLGYSYLDEGATGTSIADFREYDLMPYIQDDWHLTRKLTLNLGLRYDFYQSPWDRDNHASTYDIATNTTKLGPFAENYGNVDPRVGFAYLLPKQSTIHGGWGMYDAPILYDELFFTLGSPPNFIVQDYFNPLADPTPVATVINPHPTSSIINPYDMPPKMPTQRIEQWNLSYEKAFGSSWVASFSYLGSKLTHQELRINPNMKNQALTPGEAQVRPYPWIGDCYESSDIGWAWYKGLIAEINRNFRDGLYLNASYAYENSMDTTTGASTNIEHANDPRLDYAPSDFNHPNTYKVNATYALPIGPGKQFLNGGNPIIGNVLGGWQVSGIWDWFTGYGFDIQATDNSGTGGDHDQWANLVPGCNPNSGPKTRHEWFNTACFTQPAVGLLGDEPRNDVRSPHETSEDLSFSKMISLGEARSFQVRTDMFSAFNHPIWGIPSNSLASPSTFGEVLAFGGTRTIQMSLKFAF